MINVYEDQRYINKYINNVLKQYFEMFIEFANNLEFEDIYAEAFPKHLRDKPEYCLERLKQLNEYMIDDFYHDIFPLDEYIIYHILIFMDEAIELEENNNIFTVVKNHFLTTDKKYLSEEQIELINTLNNINEIIGFIFEDVDFLDIGLLFQHYVTNPFNFKKIFHVDLDLYVELMPYDIIKKYHQIKNNIENKAINSPLSHTNYLESCKKRAVEQMELKSNR